jgi:hypothetical protein
MSRLVLLSMLASMTGCYKINFTNGAEFNSKADKITWYHTVVAGTVELSQPIALDSICPGGWGRIHHERSPLNLAVSWGSGAVIAPLLLQVPVDGRAKTGLTILAAAPMMLYTPVSVTVHCKSGSTYRMPATSETVDILAATQ